MYRPIRLFEQRDKVLRTSHPIPIYKPPLIPMAVCEAAHMLFTAAQQMCVTCAAGLRHENPISNASPALRPGTTDKE